MEIIRMEKMNIIFTDTDIKNYISQSIKYFERGVVENVGIMVDPHDVNSLAEKMHEVLTDENLRKEMVKKGLKQAEKFSWEKCARETLKVYEEVYNTG